MAEVPAVSLLVPICNVEKYLRQCLESAREQTLSNIEIICINDGSTDSSLDIINEYVEADPRFRVLDKPNSGYGDSMNKGLSLCTGEYVGILESDDFLDSEALETMYRAAKKCDAQVVKCDFYLYWSLPEERNEKFGWVDALLEGHVNPQVEREVFYRKPSIWSAIYRRDFLEQNDISFLPSPGASYQDAGFNFKVWASCDNAVLLNEAFLHYRQDNEKSSVNSPGKVYCVCDEHDEIARFIDEKRPELKAVLGPVRAHTKFLNYRWNYDRLDAELKPEFLERFSAEMRQEIESGCIDRRYFDGSIYCDSASEGFRCFEPWEIIEIDWLANDPTYYAAHRACEHSSGKLETLKTYWNAGGLRYVYRALCGKK